MPKNNSIQIRRGSNSEWVSANPTLVSGEPAFETDTSRLKIGDGSTAWSGLNYIGSKETLSLVRNDTGDLISAGQALYVSGIYNNSTPSVAKYVADGSISQNLFIGLANSNISNNSHGYATSFGQINNLNTVGNALNALSVFGEPAWANGTLLYTHPTAAGKLTSTRPTRAILIGTVIYAHGTEGKISVKLNSQGLIFDNGTNLGIGTTTPSGQLHVIGTGIFSNKLGVGISGFPTWISQAATPHTFVHISGASGLFPDANERVLGSLLRLNNGGSTNNPRIDFRIGGLGNYDDQFFICRNGTDVIGIDTSNKMFLPNGFTILNPPNNGEGNNASIRSFNDAASFVTLDNNTRSMIIGYRGKGQGDQYIDIASSGRLKIYNYYSEVATFDNRGRFGIGTTTPSGQLHVIGSGIFSSGIRVGDSSTNGYIYGPSGNANIQFNNSTTNRIDITSTNLYLGANTFLNGNATYVNGTLLFPKTATPTSIASQSNPNEFRFYNGLWNGSSTYDGYNTLHSIASTSVSGASRFAVLMNNGDGTQNRTERLSILSNGNVGIGTTNPTANLHVNGSGIFSSGLNTNGLNSFKDITVLGKNNIPTWNQFAAYNQTDVVKFENQYYTSLLNFTRECPNGIGPEGWYCCDEGIIALTPGDCPGGVGGIYSSSFSPTGYKVGWAILGSGDLVTQNAYSYNLYNHNNITSSSITANDLLVNKGVIRVNNSFSNTFNMTINSSGINIVDTIASTTVDHVSSISLSNTTILNNTSLNPSTLYQIWETPETVSIEDLVLFTNFDSSTYNGIYKVETPLPTGDVGNVRFVRASGFTNNTVLTNGISVNVINGSKKFILNKDLVGTTSTIGSSGLLFTEDDGQSVMNILDTTDVVFAQGVSSQVITAEQKFFKIKHPDPESGYSHLQYGSLESPYNGVRLTGKDKLNKGVCEVYLPDYLKHLIHEEDVSIQLTNYGHHKMLYVDKIDLKNNKFIVKGYRSKSGGPFNFYWSFTGIRKDVSILIPEQ
jgi:hypothetical protein